MTKITQASQIVKTHAVKPITINFIGKFLWAGDCLLLGIKIQKFLDELNQSAAQQPVDSTKVRLRAVRLTTCILNVPSSKLGWDGTRTTSLTSAILLPAYSIY
jgi:hypothetical protein